MIRAGRPLWLAAAAALVLLTAAAFLLVTGDAVDVAADKPSVASVDDIEMVDFDQRGSLLDLTVVNVGRSPTTIAQVQVNYAYWAFTMSPSQTIPPQGRATLTLDYPWDHSFQIYVRLVTSAGAIAEIGLSPELGEYRTPVKSWQVLTPRDVVALTLVALAPLVFVLLALANAETGPLGKVRAALLTAASAVIVSHMLETVIQDPGASTMHGPLMRGTVGLLLVASVGFALTWACRRLVALRTSVQGSVVWTMAVSVGLYAAASALASADVAAVGQDILIPQLVAQLGIILLVRAALVTAASESRVPWSWLFVASAGVLIVAATVGAAVAAPSLSSQTWAPVFRALAIGADMQLLTIVWRTRLAGLRSPSEAFSGLGLLAAAVAVALWLTARTMFY
jgi:ZIP family zinc transporter